MSSSGHQATATPHREDRKAEGVLATETMMAHPATALPGVALAQPTIQGTQGNAQPMQHAPHAAPNAHIVAPVVEQPQAGHTPPQQAVLAKAQHIVSQYHASHPNLQHAQGARPHLQMPHQALAGSPVATNQPQPGAGQVSQGQPLIHGAQPAAQSRTVSPVVRPAAQVQNTQPAHADMTRLFKTKLFALAKEDSEVHDLWYAKGRKIKEENPELNQREWFQRIVKAVYDEVKVNKKLYHKIWSYNENAAAPKPAAAVRPQAPVVKQQPVPQSQVGTVPGAVAPAQHSMQQAQPLVPVGPVVQGQPRPVVGTAVPLSPQVGQGTQPQLVRPSQGVPLQPVAAPQQFPAYPVAARPGFPYQQYVPPGMMRPPQTQMPQQYTDAQRKKQEEERQLREEQRKREIEERRQRNQEESARKAQLKREKEEAQRQKKQQQQAEKERRAELRRLDKIKRDEEKVKKKEERERQKEERLKKSKKRPVANKAAAASTSTTPSAADDCAEPPTVSAPGKKRPPARKGGAVRKKAKTDDHPVGVSIDMDDEEAALLGAMLKMGQQHGHKAVLEDDAVLNDAPLRARLKHVAARHGVVVHSGTVKACSLAVELYLRRVLQDMIRMHEIRNGQAKDVPGMVRDLQRNWARNVAIIAETEKEAQARARHAQQLHEDQQTIANHASRRRGEELDDEEKAKRKVNVDAAKSRLGTAEAQNRVNQNLDKLLRPRQFGQRKRRLLGGRPSMLRADKQPNVMGPLPSKPEPASDVPGPAPSAGTTNVVALNAPGADVAAGSRPRLGGMADTKQAKKTLTMQDMLATLRHNPRYAHSQLHYKLLQMEYSQAK